MREMGGRLLNATCDPGSSALGTGRPLSVRRVAGVTFKKQLAWLFPAVRGRTTAYLEACDTKTRRASVPCSACRPRHY